MVTYEERELTAKYSVQGILYISYDSRLKNTLKDRDDKDLSYTPGRYCQGSDSEPAIIYIHAAYCLCQHNFLADFMDRNF